MKKIALFFLVASLLFFSCKNTPTSPLIPEPLSSIYVSSSPQGAQIWLDGANTEKVTNALLPNISPGTHTVKLVKEGYHDYQQTVTTTAGVTTQINATLRAHTITITSPTSNTIWVARRQVAIRWSTSSSSGHLSAPEPAQGKVEILAVSNVKIELDEDGNLKTAIATYIPNSGEYLWQIPLDIGGGKIYKIRVSAYGQSDIYDDSDNFSICYDVGGTYTGFLKLTQGESYQYLGVTYNQNQNGKDVSGTWVTEQGDSGTTKGTVEGNKIDVTVKMTLQGTEYEYKGTIDVENYGATLKLTFSGPTSYGYLTAELLVHREE